MVSTILDCRDLSGGGKGIRTPDLLHAMQTRYQLRHTPVELRGFEPLTFCMPCRRATNCAIAPYAFIPRSRGDCSILWHPQGLMQIENPPAPMNCIT